MIRFPTARAAGAFLAVALTACGDPDTSAVAPPEDAAAADETPREAMVAAAHPLAVEAGLDALRDGGSAVDAAIAVQTVLGLVEPQSSGLGGGAFMVRYDGESGELTVYDGRETAPAGVDETLFLNGAGEPLGFVEAWTSGRSVGAPGVVAMLAMAHENHGVLPWAAGFEDAARLAEDGFALTARTASLAERVAAYTQLDETEPTASYFYDDTGAPRPAGDTVTNPAYAETARAIAADWRNFYEGEIAEGVVAAAGEPPLPGFLTEDDLADYEPVVRDAVCASYRSYRICSAPPPSSGAVAVGQIMALLENFDMTAHGPETAEGWHYFIEASRLAYADRDRYVGDPAFADVPVSGLLDPGYLDARAALIDPGTAINHAEAGRPPGAPVQPEDASEDAPGTSHFVVVDFDGNVVSMTTTIESAFGSQRMTGGFLLNNQLTDFAFAPRDETGRLRPNAVAPGKRPRSSMSPVIVLDQNGEFVLATGSPGGNSIIDYTAKSLVAMLDWGLEPDQAAALPNVVARGDTTNIEEGFDPGLIAALREMGHVIEADQGENSGIHIVRIVEDGGLEGGADPRRDGIARGLTEAAEP